MIGSYCSFPNYQRERHAYYIGMQFFANKIIKRYGNEHIINFTWTVTHRTQGEALHFHTRLAHDEHLGDDDDDDTKTSHTVPATLLSDFHTKTHTRRLWHDYSLLIKWQWVITKVCMLSALRRRRAWSCRPWWTGLGGRQVTRVNFTEIGSFMSDFCAFYVSTQYRSFFHFLL